MIDAYKIGVLLKLETNALGVLGLLGTKLGVTDREVKHLTSSFGKMGAAATVAGLAAGAASIKLTEVLLRNGDKIIRQRALMSAAGVSPAGSAAMEASSKAIASTTPGTTPSEMMHLEQELRSNLGSSALAIKAAGSIAKDHVALLALFPQFKGGGLDIFKSIDLMGGAMKNGHLSASAMADSYLKILQFDAATSGQVSASTLRRIAQTGGFALQGVPIGESLSGLAATILELGSRAGTGIGAAAMQLEGGNASLKTVTGMERYGLIGKNGYTHKDGHYSVKPGALYGYHDLVTKGIADWITKDLVPKLKSEGVHTAPQMIAALAQILGSVRAARFLMTLSTPTGQEQAARDKELVKKAFLSNPSAAAQTTLTQQTKDFSAALGTLYETLGEPLVPKAVAAMRSITGAILDFDRLVIAHPSASNDVLLGGIGMSLWVGGKASWSVLSRVTTSAGRFLGVFGGPEAVAAEGTLETLGAGAAVAGSFLSFATGVGEVATAIAAAKFLFHNWGHPGSIAPDHNLPGFGPGGHTDTPNYDNLNPRNQSYIPPPHGGAHPLQTSLQINVDGKRLANIVASSLAHDMSLPSGGPTRFDSRMTAQYPRDTLGV